MLANCPLTPECIVSISTPGVGRLSANTLKDTSANLSPLNVRLSFRQETRTPVLESQRREHLSWNQTGNENTCLGTTKSTLTFHQELQINIDPASFRFILDDCFDTEKAGHIKALERWGSIDELGSLFLWLDV